MGYRNATVEMTCKIPNRTENGDETYSMCAHTEAPKQFFIIFAKCTVRILIYVDVITFQINLLYFLI